MFPTKEERKKNRQRNKEQMHWSTFVAFGPVIMMNNSFLLDNFSRDVLPTVIIGILISLIPFISVWRARSSQKKQRRLATKQLSEFSLFGAGIITMSFFLGMINSGIDQNIYRTIAALIAVFYWLAYASMCRYVYKRIAAVQGVDPSQDKFSKKKSRLEYSFSFVILLLGLGWYLYFVA